MKWCETREEGTKKRLLMTLAAVVVLLVVEYCMVHFFQMRSQPMVWVYLSVWIAVWPAMNGKRCCRWSLRSEKTKGGR